MEELINLIGKVSIENNCTALQLYIDDRHVRSLIRGIVTPEFRRNMKENYNMGLDYITFLKYESTDTIVFDVFYDWEIVPYGRNRRNTFPILTSHNLHELIRSPLFANVIIETFPPPFSVDYFQQGFKYHINVYWDIKG